MLDDAQPFEGQSASRLTRRDIAGLRHAVRERWTLPDVLKTEAIYQVAQILTDDTSPPRLKLAAGKLLLDIDRNDQQERALDQKQQMIDRNLPTSDRDDDYVIDLSSEDDRPPPRHASSA